MRPTPAELLQGIGDRLETVVAPTVSDPAVQLQVGLMVHVLRSVAAGWETELGQLHAAIARYAALLETAVPVIEDHDAALAARLRLVVSTRAIDAGMEWSTAELVRRKNELMAATAELLVVCERLATSGDEALRRVRAEAYAAVAAAP